MLFININSLLPMYGQTVLVKFKEDFPKYYVCTYEGPSTQDDSPPMFVEAYGEKLEHWYLDEVEGWLPLADLEDENYDFKSVVMANICGDGYNAEARMNEIIKAYNKTKVKHSYWHTKFSEQFCDECGYVLKTIDGPLPEFNVNGELPYYCPCCGSKMDEE